MQHKNQIVISFDVQFQGGGNSPAGPPPWIHSWNPFQISYEYAAPIHSFRINVVWSRVSFCLKQNKTKSVNSEQNK